MLVSTPGLVLHTTPYGETSVVARVFTRQLGVKSYMIKGVRTRAGRVKQNMLQPLSPIDMVVYDSHKTTLNHVKEISPRRPDLTPTPVGNALRFFMTEVLYKSLQEDQPLPELWDYAEARLDQSSPHIPVTFLLGVATHLGIAPLDNHSTRTPLFDLQEGRFVAAPTETTLTQPLSQLLHQYIVQTPELPTSHFVPQPAGLRLALVDALLTYFQLHIASFRHFTSHQILHTILR